MSGAHTLSASEAIAAFATGFDQETLVGDPALLAAVARTLVDTHAVALGGLDEPAVQRATAYMEGLGWSAGQASVWGTGRSTDPESAALLNGIAGHVLDYDDVSSLQRGHPSVVLWPALVALAEQRDLPGKALAAGYVVGFEVLVKLARGMAQPHYERGWHSTPGLTTVAATAGCAHALGLNATATAHALGLAVAQTAGTRQNFGSDAKSLQAGLAAAAAVRAVLLAEQGFTAGASAVDGEGGFIDLYGGAVPAVLAELAALGREPLELRRSGVEIKKYPMCYAVHRTLDGLLDLRREHGLRLVDVRSVQIRCSRGSLIPLIHHRPTTGLQAKFSMEFAVAAALADGAVRLASFDDAQVLRPDIQQFLPSVHAEEIGEALLPRFAELILTLHDGRVLQRRVDALRGSAELPLSNDELLAKTLDCHGHRHMDARAFLSAAQRMTTVDTRTLMSLAQTVSA